MTVNSKMTALADEIRELSGTTTAKGLDDMTTDIDVANAEIAEQAELLEQIATALEGKAGGGGDGEDVTAETNAYTTKLASLETAVTALETELAGKASGDSGGSVETCTVVLNEPRATAITIFVYQDSLGSIVRIYADPVTSAAGAYTVVCGTIMIIDIQSGYTATLENLTTVPLNDSTYKAYLVTAKAGETATLTLLST